MNHDGQAEAGILSAGVRSDDISRTDRAISARRIYNEKFSRIVESVLLGLTASGDHRANNTAIARALGVDESRVRAIRSSSAWTAGDALAMAAHTETRDAARRILSAVTGEVEESAPTSRMPIDSAPARIGVSFGRFCGEVVTALADGVVDGNEPELIRDAILGIKRDCDVALHSLATRPGPRVAKTRESAVKLGVAGRAAGGAR